MRHLIYFSFKKLFQVKYIFCDKTGTLTKNTMKLKHFTVAGELYLDGSQSKIINVSNLKINIH